VEKFDGVFSTLRCRNGGIEALKEIRKRDTKIPVIIITSSATRKAAIDAIAKGANEYILKPFEWQELKAKVQKVFNINLEG